MYSRRVVPHECRYIGVFTHPDDIGYSTTKLGDSFHPIRATYWSNWAGNPQDQGKHDQHL